MKNLITLKYQGKPEELSYASLKLILLFLLLRLYRFDNTGKS